MQPCSQPRYGLRLAENGTSGLSLVEMTLREWSRKNSVAHGAVARVLVGGDVEVVVRLDVDVQPIEAVGRLRARAAALQSRSRPFVRAHAAIVETEAKKRQITQAA